MGKYYSDKEDEYINKKHSNKKTGSGNSKRKEKPEEEFVEILNLEKIKMAMKFARDREYKVKKGR